MEYFFKQINRSCEKFAQNPITETYFWENITSKGYDSPTSFKTIVGKEDLLITLHNGLPDYAWEAIYKGKSYFLLSELAQDAAKEAIELALDISLKDYHKSINYAQNN